MKTTRKCAAFLAIVMLLASLTGCGKVVTTQFIAPSGTYTIQMDETWEADEEQAEGTFSLFNPSGTEGIVIWQFPKHSSYAVGDIDSMKEFVRSTMGMNDAADAAAPEMADMENVCAETAEMNIEGDVEKCYAVYGETEYAHYAMLYVAEKMTDKKIENFKAVCASLEEDAPDLENNSAVAVTDTILWFNAAHAILTRSNGCDETMFGDFPKNAESEAEVQQLLDEWWGVTDRQSADETMDWLLSEGHRYQFNDDMEYYGREGLAELAEDSKAEYLYDNFECTEEEAQEIANWHNLYQANGEKTVAGWDYSRAMSLLGYYYIAGYYSETEALDRSMEVAATIQSTFSSWDELMESYFIGYEYWADESSDERRAIYEELKTEAGSIYDIDFGMSLEKSW